MPQQVGVVNGVRIDSDRLRVEASSSGIADITLFPVSIDRRQPLDTSKFDPKVRLPSPVIEHRGYLFVPRTVVMQAGQNLTIKNSDLTFANLHFGFLNNLPPNLPRIPPGGQHVLNIPKTDTCIVSCAQFGWMEAILFVLDHPFVVVSNSDGRIDLKGLAPGKTRFNIHHRFAQFAELTIHGQAYPVTKNCFEIELQPGLNDWGTIEFSSREFKL